VQFSVVDMRPAAAMAPLCASAGVQLLTYGTLLGGLLSEKWLGAPEPRSRADLPTPSLGKYYNMIRAWGGWPLFQDMLKALRDVGARHGGASIAVVGVRYILDQPAVGGVIVGLRAGLSEHTADLSRALTLTLTDADRATIAAVQARSRDLLTAIGDCGDEYRG
jgi:aryl-alcohol dehydrogenase-like predicted oxidoreductase